MQGLIIAKRRDKEKKIDVNFYLSVHFRFRIGTCTVCR